MFPTYARLFFAALNDQVVPQLNQFTFDLVRLFFNFPGMMFDGAVELRSDLPATFCEGAFRDHFLNRLG